MKRLNFVLIGTVIVAAFSAFTTERKFDAEYVLINGRFELKQEQPEGGHCVLNPGTFCTYEKIANNGPDPYTDPTNFNGLGPDTIWVP